MKAVLALALVLLALLPFRAALDGDFIEDDRPIIRDRLELRDVSHVPALFAETYWPREQPGGLYRPLTMASYALDRALWGVDVNGAPSRIGVHATNLLLNAIAALLVLALLRERTASALASWCGAALFAVHPLHVEAVAHMVGRADLLMSALFLGAFLLHSRGPLARAGAAALYLLACLSKEMAVVLPGILLARAWLERSDATAGALLQQGLRDYRLNRLREHDPGLLLLGSGEHVDNAVDGFRRARRGRVEDEDPQGVHRPPLRKERSHPRCGGHCGCCEWPYVVPAFRLRQGFGGPP